MSRIIFLHLRPLSALLLLVLGLCLFGLSGCSFFSGKKNLADGSLADSDTIFQGTPIAYTTEIIVQGQPAAPSPVDADEDLPLAADERALIEGMRTNSTLLRFQTDAPDSLLGLERRAKVDQESAVKLMHSLGYFDGTVECTIDSQTNPVTVTLILYPGPVYRVANTAVSYRPIPLVPEPFLQQTRETGFFFRKREPLPGPSFPEHLRRIAPGRPAEADPILDAVTALPERMQRQGYPYAIVRSAHYTINRDNRTLNADVTLNPGPPAVFGPTVITGTSKVNPHYLQRLVPWKEGTPWNANLLQVYRENLQQLGLFSVIDVAPASLDTPVELHAETLPDGRSASTPPPVAQGTKPATQNQESSPHSLAGPTDGNGTTDVKPLVLPVDIRLTESTFRTVAASLRYATDVGFGIQGSWEHRNLFGSGELLRVRTPLAQEMQGVEVDFEKPAFFHVRQKFLAGMSYNREKTDAFDKTALNGYVGLERRLARYWWADARFFMESGRQTQENVRRDYDFLSLKLGLRRDTRNNVLDPVRGTRVALSVAPYSGNFDGHFQMLATELEASGYYSPPLVRKLLLAARIGLGGMVGASRDAIPASIRFYSGGGGSVRGYAFQSLGPRDENNDPTGGRSYQFVNLEARYKITETIAVVPFLDGGMVYKSELPQWDGNMAWALGLGLRYHTAIGPVRFDVAIPLNKHPGDDSFQLYISIGQAF